MKKKDAILLRGLLFLMCFLSVALSFGKNIFGISTKDLKASTQQKNNGFIELSKKKSIEVAKVELPLSEKSNAVIQNLVIDSDYIYMTSKITSGVKNKSDESSLITYVTRCKKTDCDNTKSYLAFSNSGSAKQFDKFVVNGKTYFVLPAAASNVYKSGKYYSVAKKYFALNINFSYPTNNTSINQNWSTFSIAKSRTKRWGRFNLSKKGQIDILSDSSFISIDDKNSLMALSKGNNISIYSIDLTNIKTHKEIYKFNLTSSASKPKHKKSNVKSIQDILLVDRYLYVLYSNRLDADEPNTGTSYIYTYDTHTGKLVEDNILILDNMESSKKAFNGLAYYNGSIYYSASYYNNNKLVNKIYKITTNNISEQSNITMYTGDKKNLNTFAPKGTTTWEIKQGSNKVREDFAKYGEIYAVKEGIFEIVAKDKSGNSLKQFNITIKPTTITLIVGDSRTDDLEKILINSPSKISSSKLSTSYVHVGNTAYTNATDVYKFRDSKYPGNTIYTISMRGATYKWMKAIFNNKYKEDNVLKETLNDIIGSDKSYQVKTNIIFNIGVNSLNSSNYSLSKIEEILKYRKIKNYIKQKNKTDNLKFNYYYLSINPINENMLNDCLAGVGKPGSNIRTNEKIKVFNDKLKYYAGLDGYKYCDSNSKINFLYNKPSYCSNGDGLHYDNETNKKLVEYIMTDCIN